MADPEVFAVHDGHIEALTGAGLGITLDETRVREMARDCPPWRNPAWRGKGRCRARVVSTES